MKTAGAFKAVKRSELPMGSKILSSTWAMKKKANGKYQARLNTRGFEQLSGLHYFEDDTSSPTANDVTIRVLLVIMLMTNFMANIMDVKGAFLLGRFEKGEELFMEIPQGFEKYFSKNEVIKLLVPICRLKQAARAFCKELVAAARHMNMERNKIDPCVFFK